MKPILFIVMLFLVACATTVTVDTENDFTMTGITELGTEVDFTCHVGLKSDEGVVLDSECVGFFQQGDDTYRCSIALSSEGLPVTRRISIKENCKIVVSK